MNSSSSGVLYSFRRCPYAMRARMAIHIAEIQLDHIEVSFKNKPQSLLDASPKGTVPVVITQSGKVIDESLDIMKWALEQSDPQNWLLKDNLEQQNVMSQLVLKCDKEFKPLLDRYKYFDRFPEESQAAYRSRGEAYIQSLETQLTDHVFLVDDQMRFCDVAIFPFVRQFAGVDPDWFSQNQYKRVQRWLKCCVESDLFGAIMVKI